MRYRLVLEVDLEIILCNWLWPRNKVFALDYEDKFMASDIKYLIKRMLTTDPTHDRQLQ